MDIARTSLAQLGFPTVAEHDLHRRGRRRREPVGARLLTRRQHERDRLQDELTDNLRRLRQATELPICVGFGISKPEHVRLLRDLADGVVVGSAIVRRLEAAASRPMTEALLEIESYVRSLVTALNPPG